MIKVADLDINDPSGVVDKRRGRGSTAGPSLAEQNNTTSVANLKARLTALNPTSYTAARMASMTENDLLYALRLSSSDSAGI